MSNKNEMHSQNFIHFRNAKQNNYTIGAEKINSEFRKLPVWTESG